MLQGNVFAREPAYNRGHAAQNGVSDLSREYSVELARNGIDTAIEHR